jgi:hypothetical protein
MKTVAVKINVTANDIRRGEVGSACRCPVALAVSRHLHPKFAPYVYEPGLEIYAGDSDVNPVWRGGLPLAPRQFIYRFDCCQCKNLQPLSFTLELPVEYLRKRRAT